MLREQLRTLITSSSYKAYPYFRDIIAKLNDATELLEEL